MKKHDEMNNTWEPQIFFRCGLVHLRMLGIGLALIVALFTEERATAAEFTYDASGNLIATTNMTSSLSAEALDEDKSLSISNQLSLSVTASGGGQVTYQWRRNGVDIAGETSATLFRASTSVNDSGTYSVVVSDGSSSITKQAGTVSVMASHLGMQGLAYGGGRWVAVGQQGEIVTSTDLVAWTTVSSGTTQNLEAIVYGNGKFVVVGSVGTILSSSNGTTWTVASSGSSNDLKGMSYGNGIYVAVGWEGTTITSANGSTWTSQTSDNRDLEAIAFGSITTNSVTTNLFSAVGKSGTIWSSGDGVNWTVNQLTTISDLSGVCAAGGTFVAVGNDGLIMYSTNMTNWSSASLNTYADLRAIAYHDNAFVAVGPPGKAYVSTDAVVWKSSFSGTYEGLQAAAVSSSSIVGAGANGSIVPLPISVVDHYEWSSISSPQRVGQAFSTTITAKDAAGNTVTSASSTLTISANTNGLFSDTLLGSVVGQATVFTNTQNLNLGYVFTPNMPLTVTHFGHYQSAQEVSLWEFDGESIVLMTRLNVASGTGWSETALPASVQLEKGRNYLLSSTTTQAPHELFALEGLSSVFTDGSIDQGVGWNTGAGLVAIDQRWPLVDLRYSVSRASTVSVSPSSITLSGGTATFSPSLSVASDSVVLTADDGESLGESASFQVLATGDLSVETTVSSETANTLEDLTYTVVVRNAGPGSASGVTLQDTIPANVTFKSASVSQGSWQRSGSVVTATLGSLGSQGSATVTIVVTPTSSGVMLTNAAVLTSPSDANSSNNSDAVETFSVPRLYFSSTGTIELSEGNVGTATTNVGVSIDATITHPVFFDYVLLPDSADASDYSESGGLAVILPGETSVTIPVSVNGDTMIESNETFTVVLSNPKNAILDGGSQEIRILNDDGNTGELYRFEFQDIASPKRNGQSFASTLTAKDVNGSTITTFSGSVELTGVNAGGGSPNSLLTYQEHTVAQNEGEFTFGFKFQPTNDIVVTHFRHYSGTKVSIWNSGGSLMASQAVESNPGEWRESPLETPVFLTASNDYVIGFVTGGQPYFGRIDPPVGFADGVITDRFFGIGDTFPDIHDPLYWRMVDLKYVKPAALTPSSVTFSGGSWSGNMTISESGPGFVILADDLDGHIGWSKPFNVYGNNDVATAMELSPNPPTVGSLLTNVVWAYNSGPNTANSVWLTNELPANVDLISVAPSQGTCTTNNGLVVCNIGSINGLASASVTVVMQPLVSGVSLTNVSTVVASGSDPDSSNNQAVQVVVPDLDLSLSLADGLGFPGYPLHSGGTAVWGVQTNVYRTGGSAPQSGAIGNSQTSFIQTVVRGPGTLEFWWKVSSQVFGDSLVFSTNGTFVTSITGEIGWQNFTVNVPAGLWTNRWAFTKDGAISSGSDAGWLDDVQFAVPSFSFTTSTLLPDGRLQLNLSTTNGQQLIVQGSEDLLSWSSLSTNSATGSTMSVIDSNSTNFPHRLYRAIHRNAP